MANHSLDDFFNTLNPSLTQLDNLVESLGKARALTQVILMSDLNRLDLSVLYDFLWTLDDLIIRAIDACN